MNWIAIDERLPETTSQFQMVLVATDKGVGIADYNKIDRFTRVQLNGGKQYSHLKISHWMPIPSHPGM